MTLKQGYWFPVSGLRVAGNRTLVMGLAASQRRRFALVVESLSLVPWVVGSLSTWPPRPSGRPFSQSPSRPRIWYVQVGCVRRV